MQNVNRSLKLCWVLVGLLGLSACGRMAPSYSASLTDKELKAVDRFERDRWTDVIDVYRVSGNVLRVRTRQGDELIDYRLTVPLEGNAEFVRLPIVTFGS